MSDTAVPIDHSIYEVSSFLLPDEVDKKDKSVSDLASTPGWEVLEKEILEEIQRLQHIDYQGEPFEQFGLKCYAALLASQKLEWIVNRVRATERTVAELSGA